MQEYVTVSSSSYDPAGLATKLNEKSSEGWTVVAIVPTGGDVTAFLSRGKEEAAKAEKTEAPATAAMVAGVGAAATDATADEKKPETPAAEPVSEPAGWAVAPEKTTEPAPAVAAATAATVGATQTPAQTGEPAAAATAAAAQPAAAQPAAAQPAAAQAATTPSVPAGWYADPAGRFELRYWDGSTWTEHVSRAGQQYTDAPVA
jgi:Protein of unknown function (DUF2510)